MPFDCRATSYTNGPMDIHTDSQLSPLKQRKPALLGAVPYDDIIDAACDAWGRFIAVPETITSIGMRDWAHIGQL